MVPQWQGCLGHTATSKKTQVVYSKRSLSAIIEDEFFL